MARPPRIDPTIIMLPLGSRLPFSVNQQPRPSIKEACSVCTNLEVAAPDPAWSDARACANRKASCFSFHRAYIGACIPMAAMTSLCRMAPVAKFWARAELRAASAKWPRMPRSVNHPTSANTAATQMDAKPNQGLIKNKIRTTTKAKGASKTATMAGEAIKLRSSAQSWLALAWTPPRRSKWASNSFPNSAGAICVSICAAAWCSISERNHSKTSSHI